MGRRASPERREEFLGLYGPLSLLGLLVLWVVLLVAGWGAVWWGLRPAVSGVGSYLDAVYFAGVGFFTVGFGDVLPTGGLARLLVLVEAFMGLVTMALVMFDSSPAGPAARLWRRSTRMLQNFRRLQAIGLAAGGAGPGADEARFRAVYERLGRL